jgi:hypothetical protein
MSFAALVVVVFIFLLAGLIILRPFLEELEPEREEAQEAKKDSLLAEKERLLSAIEELDRDYEGRRISGQAHSRNRNQLIRQAAEVLRKLDIMEGTGDASRAAADSDEMIDYIAAGWNGLVDGGAPACPKCGSPVAPDDKYCRQCGERLSGS